MFIGAMCERKLALSVTATNALGTAEGFASSGAVSSENEPAPVVVNGSGSYSYLWERVSGDSPTISSATQESPGWSATVTDGDPNVSTWRVTVTDTDSGETASTTITVTLIWSNLS